MLNYIFAIFVIINTNKEWRKFYRMVHLITEEVLLTEQAH